MTLDALIMLSGALVAVLPFLGFSQDWDKTFFFIIGVFVVTLGIVVRRRGSDKVVQRVEEPHFVDAARRTDENRDIVG